MSRRPHLLVAITAHGHGHMAQTAPVVTRLRALRPDLRLTIASTIPATILATHFHADWEYLPCAWDLGMCMGSALDVDVAASAAAYRALHSQWTGRVAQISETLASFRPDLLLADVPYLPLAAAKRMDIPAVAMSSLNWGDIYRHYCGHLPEADDIHGQILSAYNSAHCFLRTDPGMPMTDLVNRHSIGPIARIGTNRRPNINRITGIDAGDKLIVVSLGGIGLHFDMARWPRLAGVRWLTRKAEGSSHPDVIDIESLKMPFIDVLRSSDALIGKPGYGTFVEAACNGVPLLYTRRADWPEERCLIDWLQQHGRSLEIRREQLESGDIGPALEQLLAQETKPEVPPSGIDDAANYLIKML